jgi:hypothetical protein
MFLKGNIPTTEKFSYTHFVDALCQDLRADEDYTKVALNVARYRTRPFIEKLASLTDITNFSQRQVLAIFQKNLSLINKQDEEKLRKEAFQLFQKCEDENRRYNSADFHSKQIWDVILKARCIISKVLCRPPSVLDLDFHYGPGSTALNKKPFVEATWKYSNECFSGSGDAYKVFDKILVVDRRFRCFQTFETIEFDRLTSVAKSYKARRTISIAPELNILAQLGIGAAFSSRICKYPEINIRFNGQDKNRALAHAGSITGAYATLDLSSASDKIPYSLVRDMFWDFRHENLKEWFKLFIASRLENYMYEDRMYRYEMIAPMGNGFTFGLMTLLYFSILKGYAEVKNLDVEVYVYGDDIIVSSNFAGYAIEILQKFGFIVNKDKSFTQGHFRESCGADFHNGIDVRPVFLRKTPDCVQDIYSLINRLRSKAHLWVPSKVIDYLLKLLPKKYVIFGPRGEDVRKHIFATGFDTETRKFLPDFQRFGSVELSDGAIPYEGNMRVDERVHYYMCLKQLDDIYSIENLKKPFYMRPFSRPNVIVDPEVRRLKLKVS